MLIKQILYISDVYSLMSEINILGALTQMKVKENLSGIVFFFGRGLVSFQVNAMIVSQLGSDHFHIFSVIIH
jgi:hypothetical protein